MTAAPAGPSTSKECLSFLFFWWDFNPTRISKPNRNLSSAPLLEQQRGHRRGKVFVCARKPFLVVVHGNTSIHLASNLPFGRSCRRSFRQRTRPRQYTSTPVLAVASVAFGCHYDHSCWSVHSFIASLISGVRDNHPSCRSRDTRVRQQPQQSTRFRAQYAHA